MKILAIDPGTSESAYVIWDGTLITAAHIVSNEEMLQSLCFGGNYTQVAIEMISHMGMPAGRELFETCVWIGRFMERSPVPVQLVERNKVKLHHCGSNRAKDANVIRALKDKYGDKGRKNAPGVTYPLKSHLWQAFALASYITETAQRAAA